MCGDREKGVTIYGKSGVPESLLPVGSGLRAALRQPTSHRAGYAGT